MIIFQAIYCDFLLRKYIQMVRLTKKKKKNNRERRILENIKQLLKYLQYLPFQNKYFRIMSILFPFWMIIIIWINIYFIYYYFIYWK